MSRPAPATRDAYRVFDRLPTRWRDNDVYGHMNNAVFYEFVDTAVNNWIIASKTLIIPNGPVIGLVVSSDCKFNASLGYPDPVDAGIRVATVGRSSVRYEVGLFRGDAPAAAAEAGFTHVYVDAQSRRPVPLPVEFATALRGLAN
ncbi:acyl-CoA thioester hydrolase [Monaibacterium marinum]|uniref:Acyl-CoA thioester hydrolase n=1 Tax=Pontivivens marinum TaxID=1690039 RepID=A0A2C9CUP9_9RHOB|nr:thioesterase family protein [Monaibacterium marinum]SOH95044.1 acyl-CoA thioester hydrolase [Monaibacterium marinum]